MLSTCQLEVNCFVYLQNEMYVDLIIFEGGKNG